MSKEKQINITVPEDIWKEFGILCIRLNQTRKETLAEALQMYINLNKEK